MVWSLPNIPALESGLLYYISLKVEHTAEKVNK